MASKTSWTIVGIICIIGGLLALFNPLAASITAELLAGWTFLLAGILQAWASFKAEDGVKIWGLLGGLLAIVVGVSLLANPLQGLITLTLLVAILFISGGIVRLLLAFQMRAHPMFWAILISAVISIILGVMILNNFAQAAGALLGIMLGVELLMNGIAMLILSRRAK